MIDIHSHIVFNVDGGPSSIKESIRMVLEAERLGIDEIIATPHFDDSLYSSDKVPENFSIISSRIADCDVGIYLGYEVAINPSMVQSTRILKSKSLNSSGYVLFELPFDHVPVYAGELLYRLNIDKMIPILAHPERNRVFMKNFDSFINFLENGCLVQLDAASIIGVYGAEPRHFAEKAIKLNLAQFVASDAHCAEDYKDWYLPAYKQVRRWAGEEYTRKLFLENARKIIE